MGAVGTLSEGASTEHMQYRGDLQSCTVAISMAAPSQAHKEPVVSAHDTLPRRGTQLGTHRASSSDPCKEARSFMQSF
eukprot:1150323-Pelagomonas_calceolata.AAC.4